MKYAFWNNKGGTGKTSLAFQTICAYAHANAQKKILVIDVCPQANLSELFLGGLQNKGSDKLLARQREEIRATLGGYFQARLSSPFGEVQLDYKAYLTTPSLYNNNIPNNISIILGDPLLELQSNAISTLANTQIPGTDTWIKVIDWIHDFIKLTGDSFDTIFFDTNPSFSIYTQIAISCSDRLLLPVMADDSSRRAVQNAFSLIYGLELPSPIYKQYAFGTRLKTDGRSLPKVHFLLKNRLTQYMGPASGYAAVLSAIDGDLKKLLDNDNDKAMFTFRNVNDGLFDIRDFQTAGVVSHSRGCPFYKMKAGTLDILGRRVQVNADRLEECREVIKNLAKLL